MSIITNGLLELSRLMNLLIVDHVLLLPPPETKTDNANGDHKDHSSNEQAYHGSVVAIDVFVVIIIAVHVTSSTRHGCHGSIQHLVDAKTGRVGLACRHKKELLAGWKGNCRRVAPA
jgi:hypothetical protein